MTTTHPAPAEVQAQWRANGAWIDETLLDRLDRVDGTQLAIVDGDVRLTVDDLREQSARVAGGLRQLDVGPGTVDRDAAPELVGSGRAVLGRMAVRRDRGARSRRPCGHVRSDSSSARATRAIAVVPQEFRGTDYPALVRSTGFAGDVLEVRGGHALPTAAAAMPDLAGRR